MTDDPTRGDAGVARMEFMLQLRSYGISDAAVLRAMDEVPREYFVSVDQTANAYADHALPIACGQTISQPFIVAYMTSQLRLRPEHRVLEIGTGSGYQAAVLSRLVKEVVSIERYRTLADGARVRLKTLGYDNVEVIADDGIRGASEKAPFDRIMVTAAATDVPGALVEQLVDGGMMILPLGPHEGTQYLTRVRKRAEVTSRETLIAVRFVPLLPGKSREL
jgi:protein-L-isoaspartate(D-aspartate) O-methyltransferase